MPLEGQRIFDEFKPFAMRGNVVDLAIGDHRRLINGVFAHNLSKLALARATGEADERLADYLALP